jgi:hypothetical protein
MWREVQMLLIQWESKSMVYEIDEIKKLGLDQLSKQELDSAADSLNGFAALFGREWVDRFFGASQSRLLVLALNNLWLQWIKIRELPGAEDILVRWKSGPNEAGVRSELHVLAGLRDHNFEIELFPNCGGRVPDARFRQSESDWIYLEVSKRGISEILAWTLKCLKELATAAASVVPGKHGKVGLSRNPDMAVMESIVQWLTGINADNRRFQDLAVFHSDSIETGGGDPNDESVLFTPQPRLFSTHIHFKDGAVAAKGTASIPVGDRAAQQVLEAEASQLPNTGPGVVFLDLSRVIDGISEWEPLITRRLQPNINTRISAVVLFSTTLATNGPETKVTVIGNPYAKKLLNPAVLHLLQALGK